MTLDALKVILNAWRLPRLNPLRRTGFYWIDF